MHRPRPSLILILTLAGPVFPAQAQTLVCGATAQPSTVRLGGLTELAGDVVVACNAPQPLPSAVTATITLSFNALVTSRILSGGVTEALLFVDDPAAPVLGANVFRGALATGSALAWANVQLAPAGFSGSRIFRFKNIRLAVTSEPPRGQLPGFVAFQFAPGQGEGVVLEPNSAVAAVTLKGVSLRVGGEAFAANTATQRMVNLTFAEAHSGAFRPRLAAGQDPGEVLRTYASESGHVNTAVFGPATGLADGATRLVAQFTQVPAGAALYVSVFPVRRTGNANAQLVSADASGAGGAFVRGAPMSGAEFRQIEATGGSAAATWEITSSDELRPEELTFQLAVLGATGFGLDPLGVRGGLGPFSATVAASATAPVPRFVAASTADLSLTTLVTMGDAVTIVHTLENLGPAEARNVTVRLDAAAGLTVTGCGGPLHSSCVTEAGFARFTLNLVQPGAASRLLVHAAVDAGAPAGASVTATSTAASGTPDPLEANNTAATSIPIGGTPPCILTFDKPGTSAPSMGELGLLRLTAAPTCAWSVTGIPLWMVVSPASGVGSGAVHYSIFPNPGADSRFALLAAGGAAFSVSQASSYCDPVSVTPRAQSIAAAGGSHLASLSAPRGCVLTPAAAPSWLLLEAGSYPYGGSAQVRYSAAANTTGSPRTGSIAIGGQTIQVIQRAVGATPIFEDVPLSHPYADHVALLRQARITTGCTANEYCPDAATTRGQMAVFIMRALYQGDSFPYPVQGFFNDVPASHPYFAHIQRMREMGITQGCTPTDYCPDAPVTRGQMAVFLVRAKLGIGPSAIFPFSPVPYFTDAPAGHPYFSSIQKMKDLGITTGCTASAYCPDASTTRGEMAVFLVRLLTP